MGIWRPVIRPRLALLSAGFPGGGRDAGGAEGDVRRWPVRAPIWGIDRANSQAPGRDEDTCHIARCRGVWHGNAVIERLDQTHASSVNPALVAG